MDTRKYLKEWLQKKVASILPHYIHHRNYINTGSNEATTIRHILYIVIGAKIAFNISSKRLAIILGLSIIIVYWLWGWFWDKNKGYHLATEWSNKRNPTLQSIKRNVKGS